MRIDGSPARHRRHPHCNGGIEAPIACRRDERRREAWIGSRSAKRRILGEVTGLRIAVETAGAVSSKRRRLDGHLERVDGHRERAEPVELRAVVAMDELEAPVDVEISVRDIDAQIALEVDVDFIRRQQIAILDNGQRLTPRADDLVLVEDPQRDRARGKWKVGHQCPNRRVVSHIALEVPGDVDRVVERRRDVAV